MEAVKLTEQPSLARRRLSQQFTPGTTDRRRGSLIALEHPSILDQGVHNIKDEDGNTKEHEALPQVIPPQSPEETGRNSRRISIMPRRASAFSRVLALSSTSKSFQDELIRPTLINAMIFLDDPKPNVDRLRQTLADRLLGIPRFRCIVRDDKKEGIVFEPLARADVKVEEHIAHIDGNNSFGPKDIQDLINDAYLSTWDTSMPLWRMKIVSNLKDGRSLLFVAIDHAIGDGVGLLSMFLSLFDDGAESDVTAKDTKKPDLQKKRKKPQGLSLSHLAVAFLKGIKVGIVDVIVTPPSDPLHTLMVPKEKLNDPCPGKDFAQSRAFPLEEVKMMKNKFSGATVNDVIMALLTMAIKRYLEMKGDTQALEIVRSGNGSIRACFPVNMRDRGKTDDNSADLGNNIVMGNFPFPVEYTDPVDCVWRAKTLIDEMKVSPAFPLSKKIIDTVLPFVPDTELAKTIMDSQNRQTCMISNVMGPSGDAYLGGYSINDLNFTAAFYNSLYFGVLSFGGTLRISGILDRKTEGNLVELMKCCEDAYDELKAAVEDVDQNEPLTRPDMTPLSAKMLELLFCVLVIALPVLFALKLVYPGWQYPPYAVNI